MASNPSIRASDQDRDRTADLLREHHAVGRLDPDEFAERLDKSFSAKTVDELDKLTADLPAIDLYPLPTSSLPKTRPVSSNLPSAYLRGEGTGGARIRWRGISRWAMAWGGYAGLLIVCLVLLVAGAHVPVIVAGVIGLALITGQMATRHALGRGGSHSRLSGGQRDQRDQIAGAGTSEGDDAGE